MSYSVNDISKYVIFYSNEKNYGITNLRLQKILYFVQMYFLKVQGERCFHAHLEAWDIGPVVPKVFHKYLRFGAGQIPDYRDPHIIFHSQVDRQVVEEVVDLLSYYLTSQLVDLSMNQSPYLRARGGHITIQFLKDFIKEQEN